MVDHDKKARALLALRQRNERIHFLVSGYGAEKCKGYKDK